MPDSNNLLSSIINSLKDVIIFALDRHYRYTAFNENHRRTMKKIWGVDIEIGQNMLTIIKDPADRKKAKKNFDRALKGEAFTLIEEYGESPNRFYYEDAYSPIFDRDGQVTGLSLFLTDITHNKQIEDELNQYRHHLEERVKHRTRELEAVKNKLSRDITRRKKVTAELKKTLKQLESSEQRLEVTLRSIGDAVIATDTKGRVTLINPVAEALTGWTEAEARGQPLTKVFPIINEKTRRKVANPARRVLREGLVVGLANHTLLIHRDGREIPIADSGAPIRNAKGKIIGVVLVFRDQTEERLSRQKKRRNPGPFKKSRTGVKIRQLGTSS
ncbi:MAG: PAS domain S-box protein [Fidelibacterota bacterium]